MSSAQRIRYWERRIASDGHHSAHLADMDGLPLDLPTERPPATPTELNRGSSVSALRSRFQPNPPVSVRTEPPPPPRPITPFDEEDDGPMGSPTGDRRFFDFSDNSRVFYSHPQMAVEISDVETEEDFGPVPIVESPPPTPFRSEVPLEMSVGERIATLERSRRRNVTPAPPTFRLQSAPTASQRKQSKIPTDPQSPTVNSPTVQRSANNTHSIAAMANAVASHPSARNQQKPVYHVMLTL